MPTQARIHVSDIKRLIADRDADLSVIKLGGIFRLAFPDGTTEFIMDNERTYAQLDEMYPLPEVVAANA